MPPNDGGDLVTSPPGLPAPARPRRLARLVFFSFILTFVASRVLVILIMTRRLPDLFLHLGGNHVHHLNYGIFLLATVGGVLLFAQLSPRARQTAAVFYGLGMALTFDEFGMWLHLGGSYWQRASYDAIILLAALLGLLAFAPRWQRFSVRHGIGLAITAGAVTLFLWLSYRSLSVVERRMGERLRHLEATGAQ